MDEGVRFKLRLGSDTARARLWDGRRRECFQQSSGHIQKPGRGKRCDVFKGDTALAGASGALSASGQAGGAWTTVCPEHKAKGQRQAADMKPWWRGWAQPT